MINQKCIKCSKDMIYYKWDADYRCNTCNITCNHFCKPLQASYRVNGYSYTKIIKFTKIFGNINYHDSITVYFYNKQYIILILDFSNPKIENFYLIENLSSIPDFIFDTNKVKTYIQNSKILQ